jgi:hypothetical protein
LIGGNSHIRKIGVGIVHLASSGAEQVRVHVGGRKLGAEDEALPIQIAVVILAVASRHVIGLGAHLLPRQIRDSRAAAGRVRSGALRFGIELVFGRVVDGARGARRDQVLVAQIGRVAPWVGRDLAALGQNASDLL